jgi:hypothetical protein
MNVNVKVSLTDEQRRKIFANFYGGKKGMISRKDVNTICQTAITDWLVGRNNGPEEQIGDKVADAMKECIEPTTGNEELDEALKQVRLLQTRVNQLQHKLDTRK